MSEIPKIDVAKALKFLQINGPLHVAIKGFEPRKVQQEMMVNVIDVFNKPGIALIEAGTGTGKSMAYLIPALLWASLHRKDRTVISTNTISLQEQLVNKDLPVLLKALNLELKAVLVKGMSNYVCLRKLNEVNQELLFLSSNEELEIKKINEAMATCHDGSRSDLSFTPSHSVWEKVAAENDTCTKQDCPYYKECHYFKARRQAADAQILIVNHTLLCTDLICRADSENYKDPAILPSYSNIILDEAHHVEDVASEHFAAHVSQMGIRRILSRLASDRQGRLTSLKDTLQLYFQKKNPPTEFKTMMHRLQIDIPGMRNNINTHIQDTFEAIERFVISCRPKQSDEDATFGEIKLRLLPMHYRLPSWSETILPKVKSLITVLMQYCQAVLSLEIDIDNLESDLSDKTLSIRTEIKAMVARLTDACEVLQSFITDSTENKVRWIEVQTGRKTPNIQLSIAELDIAPLLVRHLFSKFFTIVLTSATLTTNKQFSYIRERLGLTHALLQDTRVTENAYDSPFNYKEHALFAIPTDLPDPTDSSFTEKATQKIWHFIEASQGNAFVLFTSYTMLKTCYEHLAPQLAQGKYHALKQGDDNRQSLLNRFKSQDRSVLFGTDSFWEGVDVAGDSLRCVIIVKLPFKVPSDPIIQARTEAISAKGGNAFMDYALPNAIVKFKQGFGRLIRKKEDRGCVVCLDSRLLSKPYGKFFINSVPSCSQVFQNSDTVSKNMIEFYRKTFYLVKK